MYEVRSEEGYQTYGDINQDVLTWKVYNKHLKGIDDRSFEIRFNLSDVTLHGTSDSVVPIREIVNRLQVVTDQKLIEHDAFVDCFKGKCSDDKYGQHLTASMHEM